MIRSMHPRLSSVFLASILLNCAVGVFSQDTNSPKAQPTSVIVKLQDDNATSELPFMKMATSPALKEAQFSSMYFGPSNESDVSFLVLLVGSKVKYDSGKAWAVRIVIDDIPLSKDKARGVRSIRKSMGGDLLGFHVTTEEVAWMATGKSIAFSIVDTARDGGSPDTITFSPTGIAEFKKFAQSILLIRSQF